MNNRKRKRNNIYQIIFVYPFAILVRVILIDYDMGSLSTFVVTKFRMFNLNGLNIYNGKR